MREFLPLITPLIGVQGSLLAVHRGEHNPKELLPHALTILLEELCPLLAGRGQINLQQPRIELLINQDIKSIELESVRTIQDVIGACEQSIEDDLLDLWLNPHIPGNRVLVFQINLEVLQRLD